MDKTDQRLIAALRQNARKSLSELSAELGLSRTTVRTRMERLSMAGDVLGYTVVLKGDMQHAPVRGQMLLGIEGRGTDRIVHRLMGMAEVQMIHSTNGRWDLILELGTDTLEQLDHVIAEIRRMDGVMTSETNLILSTKKAVTGR